MPAKPGPGKPVRGGADVLCDGRRHRLGRLRPDTPGPGGESQKAAEAKEATELADSNVKLSLEHFEEIFDRLADKAASPTGKLGFGKSPKVSEEDAALLNSILSFYGEFAERNTTNPRLQLDAAKAQRRSAIFTAGSTSRKRLASLTSAVAILEQLMARFPDRGPLSAGTRAKSHNDGRSPARAMRNWSRETEERLAKAVSLAEQLSAADSSSAVPAQLLAKSHARLAAVQQMENNFAGAEDHYRRAIAVLQVQLQKSPLDFYILFDLASVRLHLADCLLAKDEPAEARTLLEESIKNLKTVLKDTARFRGRGGLLSSHYQKLATVLTAPWRDRAGRRSNPQRLGRSGNRSIADGRGDRESRAFGPMANSSKQPPARHESLARSRGSSDCALYMT